MPTVRCRPRPRCWPAPPLQGVHAIGDHGHDDCHVTEEGGGEDGLWVHGGLLPLGLVRHALTAGLLPAFGGALAVGNRAWLTLPVHLLLRCGHGLLWRGLLGVRRAAMARMAERKEVVGVVAVRSLRSLTIDMVHVRRLDEPTVARAEDAPRMGPEIARPSASPFGPVAAFVAAWPSALACGALRVCVLRAWPAIGDRGAPRRRTYGGEHESRNRRVLAFDRHRTGLDRLGLPLLAIVPPAQRQRRRTTKVRYKMRRVERRIGAA